MKISFQQFLLTLSDFLFLSEIIPSAQSSSLKRMQVSEYTIDKYKASAAEVAVKTIANEIDIAAKENKKDTLTTLLRLLKTLAQQDAYRIHIDRFTLGKEYNFPLIARKVQWLQSFTKTHKRKLVFWHFHLRLEYSSSRKVFA